ASSPRSSHAPSAWESGSRRNPHAALASARELLSKATERDEVTAALFDGIQGQATRVALFTLRRSKLKVMRASPAFGLSVGAEFDASVRVVTVAAGSASMRSLDDTKLRDAFSIDHPVPCFAFGVAVAGRPVLFAYADAEGGGLEGDAAPAIEALCASAGRALERILRDARQAKSEETPPPKPATPAGSDPGPAHSALTQVAPLASHPGRREAQQNIETEPG